MKGVRNKMYFLKTEKTPSTPLKVSLLYKANVYFWRGLSS